MKQAVRMIGSALILLIGLLAVAAFMILWIGGEPVRPWIPAVLPAVLLVITGSRDLIKQRNDSDGIAG